MTPASKSSGREAQAVGMTVKDLTATANDSIHPARNPVVWRRLGFPVLACRTYRYQASPPAAAALSTFSTSRACLVGRPLVCRALFVGGATTFAGNLALLLTTHGSKAATFFARSVHSTPSLIWYPLGPTNVRVGGFAAPTSRRVPARAQQAHPQASGANAAPNAPRSRTFRDRFTKVVMWNPTGEVSGCVIRVWKVLRRYVR